MSGIAMCYTLLAKTKRSTKIKRMTLKEIIEKCIGSPMKRRWAEDAITELLDEKLSNTVSAERHNRILREQDERYSEHHIRPLKQRVKELEKELEDANELITDLKFY